MKRPDPPSRPAILTWAILTVTLTLASASVPGRADQPASVEADVILKGGTLIDGTGAPSRPADVAIRGDRIVAVGTFKAIREARVVDVAGLVIAPGFIDLHTHSDEGITRSSTRLNANYLAQGVTTIVTGNCGIGTLDAARYFAAIDAHGAGTNVIHLIPHGEIRATVLGNADRAPDPSELARMKQLVERDMEAGAWGMSTGLIYVPATYARTDELIALARVVRRHGGIYASHIRDEGAGLLASVDEALAIGEGAGIPVHISHLKASGKANWGTVRGALDRIAAARANGRAVSADQYPYIASSTKLAAMVVPKWAARLDGSTFARLAADPVRGPELRREIDKGLASRDGGSSIRIARYEPNPAWAGLDLAEIGRRSGKNPLEVVLEIQRHGGAQAISFGMCEDDVREVMRHPFVATASDGSTHLPGRGDQPHPRAYGTFPRKIRYALDDRILSLEQAVRSCSGWPAEILGLTDRGVIRPGAFADIVVFDPSRFRDSATFDRPTQYAPGVRHLFVNGVALIADGRARKSTAPGGKLPGRALRLQQEGPADTILSVGRVWTGDPARPWAEALAIRGGAIAAVGSREEVARLRGPATLMMDRPGAMAI
ncbi:MAG: N-acyl-D-amino-acid deacylase family protein, partial [Isosphaeraceae bacterium]